MKHIYIHTHTHNVSRGHCVNPERLISFSPCFGFRYTSLDLLFRLVPTCVDSGLPSAEIPFNTCQDFYDSVARDMRETSFHVGAYWVIIAAGCVFGNMLTFWGFGLATERLNKRVRDSAFSSLIRQEVSFFDLRSVGGITSQLQDDAARIHTFSGEPIRSLAIAVSSVVTGVIVSFVFMWPFALLALGCIPLMGFATSMEMNSMMGDDDDGSNTTPVSPDELNSPGGILIETLLNMRTVSALTLEEQRSKDFERATIHATQSHYVRDGCMTGFACGLSIFIQQWVIALQMWFGGYLMFHYPDLFTFQDFVISNFTLLFALFGLGAAFHGLSEKAVTEKSAGRIFYLLDRKSQMDPLSNEGIQL